MIFVFDFDGVVCDSTNECMVVAWNAWQKWSEGINFRYELSQFSNQEKEDFFKVRPRVRGAGEYYILSKARSEGIQISTQQDYEECFMKWIDGVTLFKDVFYSERERLRSRSMGKWVDLHPVWSEVIALMQELNGQNRLYIATLKDRLSVNIILQHYDLHIDPKRLYDQSIINSKLEALNAIKAKLGIRPEKIALIDDNITHLIEPHQNGYKALLSNWGSQSSEYILEAMNTGIGVITLLDIIELQTDNSRSD